jgi:hypothetical protein
MATVTLIELLASGVVTSAGTPVASGKVYAYQLGTLTPETIYSDNAGATPIVQPLVLTAGGTGIAYFANPIRLILKDASGLTTLLDVNIVGGSPASTFITSTDWNGGVQTSLQTILDLYTDNWGGSANYWKYKHANGTTERTPRSVLSGYGITPQDFGALADGAADDTTAIQAAITAALSANLPVFFPAGVYKITAALTGSASVSTPLTLNGAQANPTSTGTIIRQSSTSANGLTQTAGSFHCRNMTWDCATTSSGTGISATGGSAYLENVYFASYTTYAAANNGGSAVGGLAINGNVQSGTTSGRWRFVGGNSSVGGNSKTYMAETTSQTLDLFSTATFDMANGGNTTPTIGSRLGLVIAYNRIRGTSAGSGTVNATATPTDTKVLILECYNNSGGAFTFTLNAQYKSTGNPAPANGTRRVVPFVWNPTESVWVQMGPAATDIT